MGRYFLLVPLLLFASGCQVRPASAEAPEIAPVPVAPAVPCVVSSAVADIGTKEQWENGGPRVDEYLRSVKLGTGFYWCAAFAHAKHRECGIVLEPAREFASALRFSKENVVFRRGQETDTVGAPGYVYTMNYGKGKGHIGIEESEDEDFITGIEGNTNDGGSRNGNGVYRRVRDKQTIWTVNNYLND